MKEFFKITDKKIILLIFIGGLILISYFLSGFGAICKQGKCFDELYNKFARILSFPTYFIVNIFDSIFRNPLLNIIIIFLTSMLISYLISCTIIYIYNKNKEK